MKSLDEIPGHAEMTAFNRSNSGVHLFRAYLARRAADEKINKERMDELESRLKSGSIAVDEFADLIAERLRLHILEALDPIIEDVLYACDEPVSDSAKLKDLRHALKITDGLAKDDIERAERTQRVVSAWWEVLYEMAETGYRSERENAELVASKTGIGWRQAINIFNSHLKQDGYQNLQQIMERHYNETVCRAKLITNRTNRARIAALEKATKKKTERPKQRKRFTFGKGV